MVARHSCFCTGITETHDRHIPEIVAYKEGCVCDLPFLTNRHINFTKSALFR